ncbi:MAG TPA: hypothetical protein VJ992_05190 [Gemmatimonadales bacterium]|nr:hypothetical protein [Gemmatimonadales bacterium]
MSGVAIVSPGYPSLAGGVTDHTRRIAAHWATSRRVDIVGGLDEPPAALAARLRAADVGGLLLQYVPFLYGRRGLSRVPLELLRAARAATMRTAVFVHEPWVPPTRLPWLVLSPLQRRQLRAIVREADVAVTPVPAWRATLGPKVETLYVGSTLGTAPADAPPIETPVVFSPFAAGLQWDWIAAAVREIGAGLTVIGATSEELHHHTGTAEWAEREWTCTGRLPAEDVLRMLAGARLVLAPFVDGITGRRTSALAALSTGAQLVTSMGPLADPFFADGPLDAAATRHGFVELATRRWDETDDRAARARRRAWYEEHLDPAALDRRLLDLTLGHGRESP